jgi:hypothetical protein
LLTTRDPPAVGELVETAVGFNDTGDVGDAVVVREIGTGMVGDLVGWEDVGDAVLGDEVVKAVVVTVAPVF